MKKLVFAHICLLFVGLAAAWHFLRGGYDKAKNVLPADATAVAVFEPIRFVRDMGLTYSEICSLSSPYGARWSHAVNFLKPVYAFRSKSGLTALAVSVKNPDKLLEIIKSYGYSYEEKEGFCWVTKKNSIGCFNDDKLLMCLLVSPSQQTAVCNEMVELMSQGSHDVPALDNARHQSGALRFSASLAILTKKYARSLPDELSNPDMFLNAGLLAAGQELTLSASLSDTSFSLPLMPIKGDLTSMPSAKPFLWLCGGMNGDMLLRSMRKVSLLRLALMGLNMVMDADMMIKAIDGDVMLVVPKADLRHPDFLFTASLSNTDFLKHADEWKGLASLGVSKRGETDFIIGIGDVVKVFFGVRDGRLYIASSAEMADMAVQKADGDAFREAATGKFLSASIDYNQLMDAFPKLADMLQSYPQIHELTDAIECLSLASTTPQSMELNIETNKPMKEIFLNTWKLVMRRNNNK